MQRSTTITSIAIVLSLATPFLVSIVNPVPGQTLLNRVCLAGQVGSMRPGYVAEGVENWKGTYVNSPEQLKPGDVLMYRAYTPGYRVGQESKFYDFPTFVISAFTGFGPYRHAAIYVGDGLKAETVPKGGQVVPVGPKDLRNGVIEVYRNIKYPDKASEAAQYARQIAEKYRYDFVGLSGFLLPGLPQGRIEGEAICSEFVNRALLRKGIGIIDPEQLQTISGGKALVAPNYIGYALGKYSLAGRMATLPQRTWESLKKRLHIPKEKIAADLDEQHKRLLRPPFPPGGGTIPEVAGIDFSSVQLNYLTEFSEGKIHGLGYALKAEKVKEDKKSIDLGDASQLSLRSFLTCLTLPNYIFWVNLNPSEPERIIDEKLGRTDAGRILLEADLQLKKDLAKLTDPRSSTLGITFWDRLYERVKQLQGSKEDGQISVMTMNRFWIVPGKVSVYANENEIYLSECKLNVCLESEYFDSQGIAFTHPQGSQEMQSYAEGLTEELILPRLIEEVNQASQYSQLKQVFHSRIIAQWYKEKFRAGGGNAVFSNVIDRGDLTGLESGQPWSAREIFNEYVRSFKEGEYSFTETSTEDKGSFILTQIKQYFSGGVDLTDIKLTVIGEEIPQRAAQPLFGALCTPFGRSGEVYFFGGLFVASLAE